MIFLMHFEPEFYATFVSDETYCKRNELFCQCQCQSDSFNEHFQGDASTRFLSNITPSHAAEDFSQTDFSLSLLLLDY